MMATTTPDDISVVDHHKENSTNKNKRPNHGIRSSSSTNSKEVATEEGRNKKQKKSCNSSNENGVSVMMMKPTENNNLKAGKNKKFAQQPPTGGYIHVRARRGQATDSHSLAERVRREKISERMKMLQRLVPGCDKVTGKALVLDEIINYVQSLQNQVQFLTMKLASLNPLLCDFTMKQDTLMASLINPRLINSTALPLPSMPQPQCSSSNNQAINFGDDDYYLLNDSVSVFLQAQNTSNAFSSEDASSQIWDVEDQRQKLIDLYESNNNFCSFP